jgi:DNA-directed RNA polymerase subunit RPC12/RpoP
MIYCSNCGLELNENMQFCPKCGSKVVNSSRNEQDISQSQYELTVIKEKQAFIYDSPIKIYIDNEYKGALLNGENKYIVNKPDIKIKFEHTSGEYTVQFHFNNKNERMAFQFNRLKGGVDIISNSSGKLQTERKINWVYFIICFIIIAIIVWFILSFI